MARDLIIGYASGYKWNQIKYWVNSIHEAKFEGSVVLLSTEIDKETINKLTENGVEVTLYGKTNEDGSVTSQTNIVPHVDRFFYIWNFLNANRNNYDRVITTDVRDVIFQSDPSLWLDDALVFHDIVASSEGMRYKNEPWGNLNLQQTFGPYFHERLKEKMINNVGVIAGNTLIVEGLLSLIFHMSINRPVPIVDQAVYNFLLNTPPFETDTFFTTNSDGWAIQLGTSAEAVKAGAGDLGMMCVNDATKFAKYTLDYEDVQPVVDEDGIVKNEYGPFVIVHQWDRIPSLKEKIEKKFM